MNIIERVADQNPAAIVLAGLDKAIIGICYRHGMHAVLLYSKKACVQVLVERDNMTEEEAEDFLIFNTYSMWAGNGTPCFADLKGDIL